MILPGVTLHVVLHDVLHAQTTEFTIEEDAEPTVNGHPLLATPATVTATFPLTAPAGTGTAIDVALQDDGVATTEPNFTVLLPAEAPKLAPVMVTGVPTGPKLGEMPVIEGDVRTLKGTALL